MTIPRLSCAFLLALALPACHAAAGRPAAPSWLLDDPDATRAARMRNDVYVVPGETTVIPDVDALTPVQSIAADTLDVAPSVPARIAVDCRGRFDVASTNVYRFRLASGERARLYLDGETILDSDGALAEREVALLQGPHRIRVVYLRGPEAPSSPVLEAAARGRRYAAFQADRPLGDDGPYGSRGESPTAITLGVH
jgi:hypothetical protein